MTTAAGDQMRPVYAAAFALYRIFHPEPFIDPDYNYAEFDGDAVTRGIDAAHQLHLACRFDYPSAAGDQWWRDLEKENTFAHEIAGHGLKRYLQHYAPGIDWNERYWTFREFPGTYAQAAADVTSPDPYVWVKDPNESFAECGGAAFSGRWTKPEKTADYGRPVDPLAARAFFLRCVYIARPDLRPPTIPGVTWLPSPNYNAGRSRPVRYIVLHTTQGTDSRSWLTNWTSRVSAHYLEREDDEYQLVRDEDTAWHAGSIVGTPTTPLYQGVILRYENGVPVWSVNPNDESIGIEIEGFAAEAISPIRFNRTIMRIRATRQKFGPLPLVGHFELSPGNRSDPGLVNFAAIKAVVDGVVEEDDMYTDADRARDVETAERVKNIEVKVAATADNIVKVWLRRHFYGLDPLTRQKPTTSPPTPPADLL